MVTEEPWRVHQTQSGDRYVKLGGTWVRIYGRQEYLSEVWSYETGEHVAVFGPTQISGKTRLLFDLLAHTDTADLETPPVVLVAKPVDKTVANHIERMGYRETANWPPRRSLFDAKPNGWAYWPKHLKDAEPGVNDEYLARCFQSAMDSQFWQGRTITVADEAYNLIALHDQTDAINRHLTQGMGMGSALWFATQKPSGTQGRALSGFLFNSATHTFISRDPVKTNRTKYADIAGVPSAIAEDASYRMPPYYFLAIHRVGPRLCVVEAA
jgi:hypothetical protein